MARLPLLSVTVLILTLVCGATEICLAQDADGDGIPDAEDICPLLPNPEQRGLVKLNDPLPAGGAVSAFDVSDDGLWVVYHSDQLVDEVYEIFRVAVEGGAALRLNPPLLPDRDVDTFLISPDSSRVVYNADQDTDGRLSVFSVPMAGGDPVLLSGTHRTFNPMLVSPDGSWIAFMAPDTLFFNRVFFTVPIAGGTIYEHNTEQPSGEGNVHAGRFSPDGQWLLFQDIDGSPSSVPRLYSASSGESGKHYVSGEVTSPPYLISPDSSLIVYSYGDYNYFYSELRSTPIDANDPVALNDPADPYPQTVASAISPVEIDGAYRVVFSDNYGLSSTAIDGSDLRSLDSAHGANTIRITPDGSRVLYGAWRLFSVDILGETDPIELSGTMISGGRLEDFLLSPDGQTVVYRADQDTDGIFELFAVPVTGGDEVKISGPMIPDGDVEADYAFSAAGDTIVYRADHAIDGIFELFAASIDGGEVLKLNDALPAGGSIHEFLLTPDGSRVVYLGDQETAGVDELFSVLLYTDRDADGVYGSCDCDSGNDLLWTAPEEVSDLRIEHSGAIGGTSTLSWSAVDYVGGVADAVYDTLRTDMPNGFRSGSGGSIICVAVDESDTASTDDEDPGGCFFYVIRSGNPCAEGSVGDGRDAGVEAVCP